MFISVNIYCYAVKSILFILVVFYLHVTPLVSSFLVLHRGVSSYSFDDMTTVSIICQSSKKHAANFSGKINSALLQLLVY